MHRQVRDVASYSLNDARRGKEQYRYGTSRMPLPTRAVFSLTSMCGTVSFVCL